MKRILLFTSLILLLSACSPVANDNIKLEGCRAVMKPQPVEPVDENFVAGVNSFGFKSAEMLYNTKENLALSPVSLELALAMTRTGAAGNTADEMAKALGLAGISDENIKSACRSLMWRANTGGMEAANSIWLAEGYPFSEAFINGCTENFMADVFPIVIPGAMKGINAWAKEKTHGKIDRIISQELDPITKIVLCNALYFLGDWEVPFKSNYTCDNGCFASPDGIVTVSNMNDEREVPYYKNDKFSLVSLSFKNDEDEGRYSMAFLLPAEGEGVAALLSYMSADSFSEALAGLREQQVKIKIPKFEYTFFASFKTTLEQLGMKEAFTKSADFCGMTVGDNDLYFSDVLQKCYIRIDETGAEAAAVTVTSPSPGPQITPKEIPEFYADHPFLFAIYSQEDGVIAFLGAVNDPTAK